MCKFMFTNTTTDNNTTMGNDNTDSLFVVVSEYKKST